MKAKEYLTEHVWIHVSVNIYIHTQAYILWILGICQNIIMITLAKIQRKWQIKTLEQKKKNCLTASHMSVFY